MKNLITYIIKTARPRFWSYILGPFLIGIVFSYKELFGMFNRDYFTSFIFKPEHIILFTYFTFPFNFLMYSVNDYFDRETDKHNPKKNIQETKFNIQYKKTTYILWFVIGVITILISLFVLNKQARVWFLLLVGMSLFYSVQPIHFKRRVFLDSLSNVFYIFSGYVVFSMYFSQFNWYLFLFLACWPIAMHLYSAIPDIQSDKKAGITTSAVYLGEKNSLLVCSVLWFIFWLGLIRLNMIFLPLIIYSIIPLVSLFRLMSTAKLYWYFPFINIFTGFIYFWVILLF